MNKFVVLATIFAVAAGSHQGSIFNPRINGGDTAFSGQFPYQVSVQYGLFGIYRHTCGGAILSENWIITAGHCYTEHINSQYLTGYRIKAGVTNLDNDGYIIKVNSTIVHPDYKGGVGPNDVALMQLVSPLTFNMFVQAIKLPTPGSTPSGDVTITGWGSSRELYFADIPLISLDECKEQYQVINGTSEALGDTNICSGPGPCSKDLGGPIAQNDTLVGIASSILKECGETQAPAIFVQISSFLDFISNNVADLS